MNNKNVILLILGILLTICIVLGTSYAWWRTNTKQTGINELNTTCIKIEMEELSNEIGLEKAYPLSDEEGKELSPFQFRIKNTCNVGVDYNVNIEVLEESTMEAKNIAAKLDEEDKVLLTEEHQVDKIETEAYEVKEAYTIYKGTLDPFTSKEHEVRLWMDESADNDSQNKIFKAKVVISGVSNEIAIYTEELLNGADPVLDEKGELVPVKIGNNGEVTKADVAQEWYSYEKKEWANAVILNDSGKEKVYGYGEEIPEDVIESYFVWIPKYRYKIQTLGASSQGNEKAFEIEFGLDNTINSAEECETPMNEDRTQGLSGESGTCQVGKLMTHPAFISFDVNGLWVGKFETGSKSGKLSSEQTYNVNNVVIKPNQYSYVWLNASNYYLLSYNYKRELDSHMMKNTEWGAVAYLTQSIYGRCTEQDGITTCENVMINNNSNFVTGYASIAGNTTTVSQAITPGNDGAKTVNYFNNKSILASTTGNYTGIYDMNGGSGEYMMSPLSNQNGQLISGPDSSANSGFNGQYTSGGSKTNGVAFPSEKKYYDVYKYGTTSNDTTAYSRRILGDATAETAGWYGSRKDMSDSGYPWFGRGTYASCGTQNYCLTPAIFTMGYVYGFSNHGNIASRIVLAPQEIK